MALSSHATDTASIESKSSQTVQTPAVSLLVPICNVEKYLGECLDSAITQTLTNIEIICINDGSTDSSLDIIKSYAARDERIVIIDKPNSGYGDSMNKGLASARGTYIGILESDDILDPEALEYMFEACERDNLEVIKCNFNLFWSHPDARTNWRTHGYFPCVSPEMICAGVTDPHVNPLIYFAKPSIWSALYKRSFLEEHHIEFLPTPGASYQDASFSFKVFCAATRVRFSGRAFLNYRQDNEKSSVNSAGKVYCVCDEHAEMKRYLEEERPDLAPSMHPIRARMKFLTYRWNYDRIADEFKPDFLDRMRDELAQEVAAGYINLNPLPVTDALYELRQFQYFTENELDDLRVLLEDKTYYATRRACEASPSKMETLKAYYHAGGMNYVRRLVREKLGR